METLIMILFGTFMFAMMFATVGVTLITVQMFFGRIEPTLKMVLIPIIFYPVLTIIIYLLFKPEFVYVFWGYGGLFSSALFVTHMLNQRNI